MLDKTNLYFNKTKKYKKNFKEKLFMKNKIKDTTEKFTDKDVIDSTEIDYITYLNYRIYMANYGAHSRMELQRNSKKN